ncbi:MAG: metallophosphoesterase [Xanthomonadales bacterium]|nr:metallophosphoesterase [Xanthomonadales bacterium]
MKYLVLAFLVFSSLARAEVRQIDEYQWEGVERIVAVGDLHGDYDNYLATLRAAGIVDRKGKWAGGAAHLVQTGDIPDRGPDTLKIIEHITRLDKQARRKGGRVHSLIGNHEAMNVYGDLRYVSEGEYAAFATRGSEALRDRYFELYLARIEAQDPERYAALPADFRDKWNMEHPLGWLEHRQAWDPAWNPDGQYAKWVLNSKVAIRINETLFLHGGISGFYCQNSLDSLTENVRSHLKNFEPGNAGILEDDFGPLWYRGLSGVEPLATPETVDAILAQHGIKHIAVGHTPTSGVIWPRYDAKVIMIDTGISRAYGGHLGYLEITSAGLFAGYEEAKLPLPASDDGAIAYLEQVIQLKPDNPYLRQRLNQLRQPPAEPIEAAATEAAQSDETAEPPAPAVPTCGISK